jgi:hypothetical protein
MGFDDTSGDEAGDVERAYEIDVYRFAEGV